MKTFSLLAGAVLLAPGAALACDTCKKNTPPAPGQRVVEYDLHISEQRLAPAGRMVRALTINGGIPGPVLRFREGDFARIRVHNDLRDEETSTHWHGLLLPNKEDGVPHVTTPPIQPGTTHTFEFPLRQSGTYWFHSHTHLQEQSGVYGGIVVEPRGGEPVKADREQVLILSDWTNTDPYEVMRMLMRGSDYFGIMRRNSQSILGAWQRGNLKDYFRREWSRMVPMDVSDVGYHAFLINGQRQTRISGHPGERVRERHQCPAATYFPPQFQRRAHDHGGRRRPAGAARAGGQLSLRPSQRPTTSSSPFPPWRGMSCVPPPRMAAGRAPPPYWAREERHGPSARRVPIFTRWTRCSPSRWKSEADPRAPLRLPRPGSPYKLLKATHDTTLPSKLPRRRITLHLTGDMVRYVWSFDGKTIAQEPYIKIRKVEII
ncbi:multicopper oxidase domain-containing protein [Prosthecobacter sp.]|uniref:multicopper oxidase domain-containing protein n=1 Tax=Prosthecobacter sp. TaxID=1965333 RepID=UPI003784053A